MPLALWGTHSPPHTPSQSFSRVSTPDSAILEALPVTMELAGIPHRQDVRDDKRDTKPHSSDHLSTKSKVTIETQPSAALPAWLPQK